MSMADLHIEQRYDETPRSYLDKFMELTSQIFKLDLRHAANLFVGRLLKGSLLHERFIENPPYDLNELKSRAKGILRVVESRQQIAKSDAMGISHNNSRLMCPKDTDRRMRDNEKVDKPSRDK